MIRNAVLGRKARWVTAAVIAAALALVACTGSSHHSKGGVSGSTSNAANEVASRWWTNSGATKGSLIDASDPGGVAVHLAPSQTGYCSMLKDTLVAGRSIFPNAKPGDAALVTSTKAFLAEIQSVAPSTARTDWTTLAPTLVALVSGKPLPANTSAQAKKNAAAVKALNADAKANCGLNLSAG